MDPNYPNHPNHPYYSQQSASAQVSGYPAAGSAASAHVNPREIPGFPSEPVLNATAAYLLWQPQWIRRFIELRATEDPAHPKKRRTLPFDKVLKILQAEFPGKFNMDDDDLSFAWRDFIRPTLGTGFRTMLKPSEDELAVLSGGQQGPAQPGHGGQQGAHQGLGTGSQRPYQDVHALSYNPGAPQQDPNAPYGASQPGYGGTQQTSGHVDRRMAPPPGPGPSSWGPQFGQGSGYHGAAQAGPGGQYPNAPGMDQSPAPDTTNVRLPPSTSFNQASTNQGYQSMQNQDDYNSKSQAGPSGSQEQMTFYRPGPSHSRRGAPREGEFAMSAQAKYDHEFEFAKDEIDWLLENGIHMGPKSKETKTFHEDFLRRFPGRKPSQRLLVDRFNWERTYRQA